MLIDCSHSSFGNGNCASSQDIALECVAYSGRSDRGTVGVSDMHIWSGFS